MDLVNQYPLEDFVLNINTNLLWGVYSLVVFVYIIFTLVLLYHWERYGMRSFFITLAEIAYFVATLGLLSLATLAISSF